MDTKAQNGYVPGNIATDFELMNVDGKMVSLSDYADAKGFIVIFTCNHCPYAIAYEDRIIALDKKYMKDGFPVIAINPNDPELKYEDSYEHMKVRAREKEFTFPYLFDKGQKIYPQYGATRTPHAFVLEKTNKGLIVRYIGAIDDNYQDASSVKEKFVENAISAIMEGKKVQTNFTKAIGCSIKSK